MLPERWRAIPGWPGYEASDRGQVRSARGLLTPTPDRNGYRRVTLYRPGERKRFGVGQLVLLAHAGPPEVLHGPGGHQDDSLSNLRYGSRLENERDKRKTGRKESWERPLTSGTPGTGDQP